MKEFVFSLPGARVNYEGQGTVYIALPENIRNDLKVPAIVAVHGSGRCATDYRDTPFYMQQRDIALKNGCLFAAVSNYQDTWGLDDGLYNTHLLIDHIIENYNVKPSVGIWATSAGGVLANQMVAEYPDKVAFVIGTFPVFDLLSGFALKTCKAAWKTDDLEQFKGLIENKNPAAYPQKLTHHKYYIAHGTADAAVPISENSEKMQSLLGNNVYLEKIENGVHGTADYSYYGKAITKAFLDKADYLA